MPDKYPDNTLKNLCRNIDEGYIPELERLLQLSQKLWIENMSLRNKLGLPIGDK